MCGTVRGGEPGRDRGPASPRTRGSRGRRADVTVDVAIVGGIAGAALATVLARESYEVLLLERRDHLPRQGPRRVPQLLGRGGDARARPREAAARCGRALRRPLRAVRRGDRPARPPRPTLCRWTACCPAFPGAWTSAIHRRARAWPALPPRRATVLRGVGDVEVVPGTPPALRYESDDLVTTVSAGLVVGADGRTSGIRRQLGIALHETRPRSLLGGMLVDGLEGWPADQMSLGTEGDVFYFRVPPGTRAGPALSAARPGPARALRRAGPARRVPGRLPVALPAGQRDLPGGPRGRPVRVLPDERHVDGRPVRARGRPDRRRSRLERPDHRAGPVDRAARRATGGRRRPCRSGPLGRGLRPLRAGATRADAAAAGRRGGPDRLAATFTPAGAARRKAFNAVFRTDPVLGGPRMAPQLGPDNVPAEAFGPDNVARILAMGDPGAPAERRG